MLVVNGPRGSGKSYTIAFLQHFATQTETFDLIATALHPPEQLDVFEFAQTIAMNASLNAQSLPASKSMSGDRYIKELAAWLGAQVQRRRRQLLICVDNWDGADVNPEIISYIQEVMRVCTRGRNLLLVLLGFPSRYIPKDCEPFVTKEDLKPLSSTDVEQFLTQLEGWRSTGICASWSEREHLGYRLSDATYLQSCPSREAISPGQTAC